LTLLLLLLLEEDSLEDNVCWDDVNGRQGVQAANDEAVEVFRLAGIKLNNVQLHFQPRT